MTRNRGYNEWLDIPHPSPNVDEKIIARFPVREVERIAKNGESFRFAELSHVEDALRLRKWRFRGWNRDGTERCWVLGYQPRRMTTRLNPKLDRPRNPSEAFFVYLTESWTVVEFGWVDFLRENPGMNVRAAEEKYFSDHFDKDLS